MKKSIIILATVLLPVLAVAQVAIGKTTVTNGSVLLEFGTDARGIRLTPVQDVTSFLSPVKGTIAFDGTTASFRYFEGAGAGAWSAADTGTSTGGHPAGPDATTTGVVIGASSPPVGVTGALILESTNKALVLPKVSDVRRIASPPKGLLVYDTFDKTVRVYNGVGWVRY